MVRQSLEQGGRWQGMPTFAHTHWDDRAFGHVLRESFVKKPHGQRLAVGIQHHHALGDPLDLPVEVLGIAHDLGVMAGPVLQGVEGPTTRPRPAPPGNGPTNSDERPKASEHDVDKVAAQGHAFRIHRAQRRVQNGGHQQKKAPDAHHDPTRDPLPQLVQGPYIGDVTQRRFGRRGGLAHTRGHTQQAHACQGLDLVDWHGVELASPV